MIKSVNNFPISQLLDIHAGVIYTVPRYQREYSWGKSEWQELFDDFLDNDYGYFLGSIICINQSKDALSTQKLELVDGQQRMVTLSLLFAAIYSTLSIKKEILTEDQLVEAANLKWELILKKSVDQIRVVPQEQNNNLNDYSAILKVAGAIRSHQDTPHWAANRKIFKAYHYFLDRIDIISRQNHGNMEIIIDLLEKINRATMVKIEAANHSDAYTLFESLNNRGIPLTAVDIIKNKLFAKIECVDSCGLDSHFNSWNQLLNYLGDDFTVQERFFRQYYNAFKKNLDGTTNVPMATRSNLIKLYEKMIDRDPANFLENIIEAGKCYSLILNHADDEDHILCKPLLNLERIEGTPSYILLLHLLVKKDKFDLNDKHLSEIIQYLINFFVRRNLTDIPPTRDLIRLFMNIIMKIEKLTDEKVLKMIKHELVAVSSDEDIFRKRLEGPVYSENLAVARFILCSLEEREMNKENWKDLWAIEGKQYVWTIEHIFPQGHKIPKAWANMIAEGDMNRARELQSQHADRLGNLTITGFNSTLGNKSFEEKRDRKDRKGRPMGYRNGLYLNDDIKLYDKWTVDHIERRTKRLANEAINLFQL